jgi:hypothetical protein
LLAANGRTITGKNLDIDQVLQLALIVIGKRLTLIASQSPPGHELLHPLPLLACEEAIWDKAAHDDECIRVLSRELCCQRVECLSSRAADGLVAGRNGSIADLVGFGVFPQHGNLGHDTFLPARSFSLNVSHLKAFSDRLPNLVSDVAGEFAALIKHDFEVAPTVTTSRSEVHCRLSSTLVARRN